MPIGKRIKNLRDKNGLTQRELVDKININYSVMNRIETGERPARDEEIKKTRKSMQVSDLNGEP